MDKVREEFEAWFADVEGFKPEKSSDVGYHYEPADYMWNAWKASRAALRVELPENCKGMALTVDEFHAQLDKAGVSYK